MMRLLFIVCLLISSYNVVAKCSKAEAKKAVLAACAAVEKDGNAAKKFVQKKLRFCKGNYVWVQDSNVKMIVHPIKPRLNGKDLKKFADTDGVKLFVEFDKMAKAKAEGGWVDYKWTKPRAEKATDKTSFVKKCGGSLGWIAGAGVWKSDL